MTLQCLEGEFKVFIGASIVPNYNPKLTLRSVRFKNAVLCELTNASFRHVHENLINYGRCVLGVSTLKDLTERTAQEIHESYTHQRDEILSGNGFCPTTGLPLDSDEWAERCSQAPAAMDKRDLAGKIKEFNDLNGRADDPGSLIRTIRFAETIESSKDSIVQIDADEVMTKKQTFERDRSNVVKPSISARGKVRASQRKLNKRKVKARHNKKSHFDSIAVSSYNNEQKNVNTTVIRVKWDENLHVIKGESVSEAFKSLIALLLENGLMTTRRLVFFIDGASSLKKTIQTMFSYASYHIVLDWYHITVSIMQMLSMALSGKIDQKRGYRSELTRPLWHGDVSGSLSVLKSFVKKNLVRNSTAFDRVSKYLLKKQDEISCYALRKHMGLPNSSSQGEKFNDILVASRQKHNGMSWSVVGSNDLSRITAANVNNKLLMFLQSPEKVNWFNVSNVSNEDRSSVA